MRPPVEIGTALALRGRISAGMVRAGQQRVLLNAVVATGGVSVSRLQMAALDLSRFSHALRKTRDAQMRPRPEMVEGWPGLAEPGPRVRQFGLSAASGGGPLPAWQKVGEMGGVLPVRDQRAMASGPTADALTGPPMEATGVEHGVSPDLRFSVASSPGKLTGGQIAPVVTPVDRSAIARPGFVAGAVEADTPSASVTLHGLVSPIASGLRGGGGGVGARYGERPIGDEGVVAAGAPGAMAAVANRGVGPALASVAPRRVVSAGFAGDDGAASRGGRTAFSASGLMSAGAAGATAGGDATEAAQSGQGGAGFEGDVFLDGALVGRWISRMLTRDAERAAVGRTGFDIRRGRLLPGPTVGGP